MRQFIKFCILLCLPIVVMVVFYIIEDPYKVIWHYDNYYPLDNVISLNRGYVSTMHYINHQKECDFDSFIFGNSRSIAYYEEEWKKYLPISSRCYHFDCFFGSVGDLSGAIKCIDNIGTLQNALIILDHDILSKTENKDVINSLPPILKSGKGKLIFHNTYIWPFYKFGFFRAYLDYKIHKEFKPYMITYFIDPQWRMGYNPINNEFDWDKTEERIAKGMYYDSETMQGFENAQFPGTVSRCVLNDERKEMLKEIKGIFDSQKTDYRIVISPIYDQIKINPDDLQFLYDVFGEDHVFDFSGINKWNEDFHNYYETSHYRPCVANEIMQIVYSE